VGTVAPKFQKMVKITLGVATNIFSSISTSHSKEKYMK